jgi:methionine-S-sulfoxide reductase
VVATAVGYSGGHVPNPTYGMVCGKGTGHAEVVLVEFDPQRVSYERLLDAFFEMHEPGYSRPGSQYRSAIFTFDEEQREVAERTAERLRAQGLKVLTEITPASTFWPAEDYHQQYYEKRGLAQTGSCGCLVAPVATKPAYQW